MVVTLKKQTMIVKTIIMQIKHKNNSLATIKKNNLLNCRLINLYLLKSITGSSYLRISIQEIAAHCYRVLIIPEGKFQ